MKFLGLGIPELIIILVVILLIFGPKNLPKLGKAFGKSVSNLREGMNEGKKQAEGAADEASDGEAADGEGENKTPPALEAAAEEVEERRFPGSAGPQDNAEIPFFDFKRDVMQSAHETVPRTVMLADVFKGDITHGSSLATCGS